MKVYIATTKSQKYIKPGVLVWDMTSQYIYYQYSQYLKIIDCNITCDIILLDSQVLNFTYCDYMTSNYIMYYQNSEIYKILDLWYDKLLYPPPRFTSS